MSNEEHPSCIWWSRKLSWANRWETEGLLNECCSCLKFIEIIAASAQADRSRRCLSIFPLYDGAFSLGWEGWWWGSNSSVGRELGWGAEGAWFKSQYRQAKEIHPGSRVAPGTPPAAKKNIPTLKVCTGFGHVEEKWDTASHGHHSGQSSTITSAPPAELHLHMHRCQVHHTHKQTAQYYSSQPLCKAD